MKWPKHWHLMRRRITSSRQDPCASQSSTLHQPRISHAEAAWPALQNRRLGVQSYLTRSILTLSNESFPRAPRYQQLHGDRTITSTSNLLMSLAALTEAQRIHWHAYLATGRGSVALFRSMDQDNDRLLSKTDVRNFIQAVQQQSAREIKHWDLQLALQPKALQILAQRADDQPLSLPEFQQWLLGATEEAGYVSFQPSYEALPLVGQRRSQQQQEQPPPKLASSLQPQRTDPPLPASTTHTNVSKAKTTSDSPYECSWNASTMNQGIRRMQYAVRGDVVMRADALAAQGRDIIYTNVGNPHAVGQQPLTFYRQVMALCDLPNEAGLDHPAVAELFPADVRERARQIKSMIGPAGTGAYTNSQGVKGIRKQVADFITNRDRGYESYEGDIFLTNGASSGIEMILCTLIAHDTDAIMIPIPQYPIYSALITRLGGRKVGYYLDEEKGWAVTPAELEKKFEQAKDCGLDIRGMALINPGNPTGQVMARSDLETVCLFCAERGIVLLADEVYQRNVYTNDRPFVSAKKVAVETPGCEQLQLISFHSTSKGLIGECGRRGGYMELHQIDPYVHAQLYKLASSGLCSGVPGQVMTSLMVQGPNLDGDSYSQFVQEEKDIFDSLARRAGVLVRGLNAIEGIVCNDAQGAMYAFPRVYIPPKALEEAEKRDLPPDTLYALSLLEETGICVVPASGFGQAPGRVGFRTTFLPQEDQLRKAIDEFGRHHELFCQRYAS